MPLLTVTTDLNITQATLNPQQLSTTDLQEAVTVLEVMFPELLDTTIPIAIADSGNEVTTNNLVVRALPDRRPPLRSLHLRCWTSLTQVAHFRTPVLLLGMD